eukprot:3941838-Rhodomonas_salina.4
MTIHSDWAKVIKSRYPRCFTSKCPSDCVPACGIIDGHIQLMGAYHVDSWDHFLQKQFASPVARLFASGCKVVVLLFDNRLAVSPYKGMTQYKRCTRYQEVDFSSADSLPSTIPTPLTDYMMNRHFKDKVISFICERIQLLVKPSPDKTLIVDFKGPPKLYNSSSACPIDIQGLTEMGESDVKFTRYVHIFGNSIVYATDGDYLVISLLYYTVFGLTKNNNILIYRQTANIGDKQCDLKAGNAPAKTKTSGSSKPKGRSMEYVNMQMFFKAIVDATGHTMQIHESKLVLGFVSMMLLCGTDYSRGLPMVGPKRLIEIVPQLLHHMQDSLQCLPDEIATEMHPMLMHYPDPISMSSSLVYEIYRHLFQQHIPKLRQGSKDSLSHMVQSLQASKLADRTKTLLPSIDQIHTTCRNVCWVIHYWRDCINAQPECNLSSHFGFVYNTSTRQYTWADILPPSIPDHQKQAWHTIQHSANATKTTVSMPDHSNVQTDETQTMQMVIPTASHTHKAQMHDLLHAAQTISEITKLPCNTLTMHVE